MPADKVKPLNAAKPKTGIVHLGLGAFFRAFGCVYVSDAMAASGGNWGITSVSLRSPSTRDALRDQGWAYTSVSLGADGIDTRVIEVLNDVLVAPENPQAVLDAMADPDVKIVTLTVTEKGYCHNPATGELNLDHPDIQHDLANELPVSTPGFLVRALAKRKEIGLQPFTVLTCDNLPDNGRLVRGLVLELAGKIDPALSEWIKEEGRFPCTMVDRITPATTADDIASVEKATGLADAAPVMHEPFAQWAIEDNFVSNDRPDFAAAGVEMVSDVAPHENMKLRMLNGTHSGLAYSGFLAGHQTISDTVSDPVFRAFGKAMWAEIIPTVAAPPGVSLEDYAKELLSRYSNTQIQHRTFQIAMDGSQKLPQRILSTIRDRFESGRPAPMLCLAVACWMRYTSGVDEKGDGYEVQDPMADALKQATGTPAQVVSTLLSMQDIFPPDLAKQLLEPVSQAAQSIWELGARDAISQALASSESTITQQRC